MLDVLRAARVVREFLCVNVAWWAIVKLVLAAWLGVPVPTSAWTVTRSPCTNGRDGRKLSPVPVE